MLATSVALVGVVILVDDVALVDDVRCVFTPVVSIGVSCRRHHRRSALLSCGQDWRLGPGLASVADVAISIMLSNASRRLLVHTLRHSVPETLPRLPMLLDVRAACRAGIS